MASATWPSTLPQAPQQQGYGEQPQARTLRTQMDAGLPKQRQRFTAGTNQHTVRLQLTQAQWETLLDFWDNTLGGGALPFDWQYWHTGANAEYRFVGSEPPQRKALGGDLYEASFTLEELPG